MGEEESYKAARELGNTISDYSGEMYKTMVPLSITDIKRKKDEVVEKKEALFKRLSESYDSHWVSPRRNRLRIFCNELFNVKLSL